MLKEYFCNWSLGILLNGWYIAIKLVFNNITQVSIYKSKIGKKKYFIEMNILGKGVNFEWTPIWLRFLLVVAVVVA